MILPTLCRFAGCCLLLAGAQIAQAQTNPLKLPAEVANLRFPEGDAIVIREGKTTPQANRLVTIEVNYEPKNAKGKLTPLFGGALYTSSGTEYGFMSVVEKNKSREVYHPTHPGNVLNTFLEAGKAARQPVSVFSYNAIKAPDTGVVLCTVTKHAKTTIQMEGRFPSLSPHDLSPKAIGVFLFHKVKSGVEPMGNVIWIGVGEDGVATPTLK